MSEVRLCRCGCGLPILKLANERQARFEKRKYATFGCSARARTLQLEPRYCQLCNALIKRRRSENGSLERPDKYLKRKYCSPAHSEEGRKRPVSDEKRLCECGCERELTPRPKEKAWSFERRRFASVACSRKHRTAKSETIFCGTCEKPLERRRFSNGVLESVVNYNKRQYCSRQCQGIARTGKPRSTKPTAKPPTASQKPRKAATKPKAVPKPKPTPSKPLEVKSERVFTGLPDPRSTWQTIAPATIQDNPCPLHPSERAGSCTSCKIASTPHRTVARVGDSTAIWRRN